MQHRLLLACAFLYLAVSNLIWLAWDTRPPFWDLALHQSGAVQILNAFSERGLMGLTALPYTTGFYPPLFHSVIAAFYAVFGVSPDTGAVANIPATAILLFATYRIGRRLLSPMGGTIAAILVAFYPLMVWLSRETLIDYWLAAMVALAFAVLIETEGFTNRRMVVLFGIVCGLGMLTKWTFAVFLVFPALWFAWRRIEHALLAAAVAAGVASVWYVPRLDTLGDFLSLNTAGGVSEGDPSRLSWQAVLFYIRALEGYQLYLPLFLLFLAGLAWTIRNFHLRWVPVLLWVAGAGGCLLFFQNKDPRYTLPLLPGVALISAAAVLSVWSRSDDFTATAPRRHWVLVALFGFLFFQHYMISFGIPMLPPEVVIARGSGGALHRDWYLYSQHYLDLLGPPAREDWRIDYVLDRVGEAAAGQPVRVGMIPDIPRFDWMAFEFYILARRDEIRVRRLVDPNPEVIRDNDFILLSEGAQGYGGVVRPEADRINAYIFEHEGEFQMLDRFGLPNGESIRLYQVRQTALARAGAY